MPLGYGLNPIAAHRPFDFHNDIFRQDGNRESVFKNET
jgi:hypothetical protein